MRKKIKIRILPECQILKSTYHIKINNILILNYYPTLREDIKFRIQEITI